MRHYRVSFLGGVLLSLSNGRSAMLFTIGVKYLEIE
jgi:hypothetical protein